MRAGLSRELAPAPIRVPALQREPGELSHQVELRRPDVAVGRAEHSGLAAIADAEMVRHEVLVEKVDRVDPDTAAFAPQDRALLAARQLAQARHAELHDEAA